MKKFLLEIGFAIIMWILFWIPIWIWIDIEPWQDWVLFGSGLIMYIGGMIRMDLFGKD